MKKKVLDITNLNCPMSFLKTKQFLKVNKKQKKSILIKGEKNCDLLSNSLRKNFSIKIIKKNNEIFEIELL